MPGKKGSTWYGRSAEDRFWLKVDRDRGPDSCWLWLGSVDRGGYGNFKTDHGVVNAHAFAWDLKHGPPPPGLVRDHLCGVRRCVNTAHMRLTTKRENDQQGGFNRAKRMRKEPT
jgi:hypothetical protein